MKYGLVILLISLVSFQAQSQNIAIAANGLYNFQTESIGYGARVSIFPANKFSITPQFSYFPAFNKINEYTAGLALEYKFALLNRTYLYAIAQGAYNNWINYIDSGDPNAQATNWNVEGGLGISGSKCLRPFAEFRYNLRFQETHLDFGILYILNCETSRKTCPSYL